MKFKKSLLVICIIAALTASAYFFVLKEPTPTSVTNNQSADNVQTETVESTPTTLRIFTAEEFMSLYNNFVFPNTSVISEIVSITGNRAADERIQAIAESRGYKLRSIPKTNLFKYKEYFLQEKALKPWLDMQAAASAEGIKVEIISAFRAIEEQRTLFLSRLSASPEQIASGRADSAINTLLNTTAAPGYSRHHNGYTIDLSCTPQPGQFKSTTCFKWLSKNNYENAKKFGWIPSYPEGIEGQGPEPEEWEYVWVGIEAVYE